jgi:hypothetical protein
MTIIEDFQAWFMHHCLQGFQSKVDIILCQRNIYPESKQDKKCSPNMA